MTTYGIIASLLHMTTVFSGQSTTYIVSSADFSDTLEVAL